MVRMENLNKIQRCRLSSSKSANCFQNSRLFMGNITRNLPKDGIGALKIGTTDTGGGGGGGGSTGIGSTGTGTGSGIGLDCFP